MIVAKVGYIGNNEFLFKICCKFEKLCWCVVLRTANLINNAFCLGNWNPGSEVSRFPICVISVDRHLRICSYRQAPLMILNISLQMREKAKQTDIESSPHILLIKMEEAEMQDLFWRLKSREVISHLPGQICSSLVTWLRKVLVSGSISVPFVSLGHLGWLSQWQEWVLIVHLGSWSGSSGSASLEHQVP